MKSVNLLDHPPVVRALDDPAMSGWLADLLGSASSRDPVDVLCDLEQAYTLVSSYFGAVCLLTAMRQLDDELPGVL